MKILIIPIEEEDGECQKLVNLEHDDKKWCELFNIPATCDDCKSGMVELDTDEFLRKETELKIEKAGHPRTKYMIQLRLAQFYLDVLKAAGK